MKRDYFNPLMAQLTAALENSGDQIALLTRYKVCVDVFKQGIEAIRKTLAGQPFEDKQDEIRYYREEAPKVHGRLFFYQKLVELEVARQYTPPEKSAEILRKVLSEADQYIEKHEIVCAYCIRADTYWDDYLFLRRGQGEWSDREAGAYIDGEFTIGAYWLSWINAYQHLKNWVTAELEQIERPPEPPRQAKRLKSHAKAVEAVEILKGLHLIGFFGNSSFKEVIGWAREEWSVRIGNHDQILQDICNRKINPTKCIDRIKEALENWMDEKL